MLTARCRGRNSPLHHWVCIGKKTFLKNKNIAEADGVWKEANRISLTIMMTDFYVMPRSQKFSQYTLAQTICIMLLCICITSCSHYTTREDVYTSWSIAQRYQSFVYANVIIVFSRLSNYVQLIIIQLCKYWVNLM